MVQAVQLSPAWRAWRKVGRPVATMVPSSEDMKRAIETIAKTSQGDRDEFACGAVPGSSKGVVGPARTAPSARSGGGPSLRAIVDARKRFTAPKPGRPASGAAGGRVRPRGLPARAVPVPAPELVLAVIALTIVQNRCPFEQSFVQGGLPIRSVPQSSLRGRR